MKKSLGIILVIVLVLSLPLIGCKQEVEQKSEQEEQNDGKSNDWDGDGLSNQDEIEIWHTNPFDTDSDGDGYNDYLEATTMYEATGNTFHPAIADLPDIKVIVTSTPEIVKVTETSKGETKNTTVSESESQTGGISQSNTDAHSSSSESYWGVSVTGDARMGTQAGAGIAVSVSGGHRWSSGDTATFSQTQNQSLSESYSESISSSSSFSEVFKGGKISVSIKIKNESDISYNVENLSLIAYGIAPGYAGEQSIITNMYINPDASDPTSVNVVIPGGEERDLKFSSPLISVEGMKKLMVNSSGIYVALGTHKITISSSTGSHDFTATTTNVGAKTAMVSIDYGPTVTNCKNEKYNVSTKIVTLDENDKMVFSDTRTLEDLLYTTMRDAIVYEEDSDGYNMIRSIRGVEGSEYNPEMSGRWFISHTRSVNGNEVVNFYSTLEDQRYNPDEISVVAGDLVEIIYSIDHDCDGLPLRTENLYGTSDDSADSDGDGISDYDEVVGWTPTGATETICTNPNCADTDGDGISDDKDPYPLISAGATCVNIKYLDFTYTPFGSSSNASTQVKVHDLTWQDLVDLGMDKTFIRVTTGRAIIYLNVDAEINSSAFVLTPVKEVQAMSVACWMLTETKTSQEIKDFIDDGTGSSSFTVVPISDDGTFVLQKVPFGEFKLLLKVLSADETEEQWVIVTVNCPLQTPSNFRVSPNGEDAVMRWSAVTDTRDSNILIIRSSEDIAEPDTTSMDAALASDDKTYTSGNVLYQVLEKTATSNIITSGYGTDFMYHIYTFYEEDGKYVFSEPGTAAVEAQVPDYYDVKLVLKSLTITDDHGDAGDGFELTWDYYYSIDGATEMNFESHGDEWKTNCTATFTYDQGNGFELTKKLASNADHVIKVRMYLTEHDTGLNGDDHKTLYFYIIYKQDAGKFYINYDKNSVDGAAVLSQGVSGNLDLQKEIESSGCVDGNLKFDLYITGSKAD